MTASGMRRRRPISGVMPKVQPPPHEKPHEAVVLSTPTPIDKTAAKEAAKFAREVAKRDDAAA